MSAAEKTCQKMPFRIKDVTSLVWSRDDIRRWAVGAEVILSRLLFLFYICLTFCAFLLFFYCERLDHKQPFNTNKVELHFVCCVELGHAVSPIAHISSQLLRVTFHLLPSPSIHYSAWLVRLSTSCFSRSLNLTPHPAPPSPPHSSSPFKASSLVLHLLFLLESLTHLINNTHTHITEPHPEIKQKIIKHNSITAAAGNNPKTPPPTRHQDTNTEAVFIYYWRLHRF